MGICRLSQQDFDVYAAKVRGGAKTAFIPGGVVEVPAAQAAESAGESDEEPARSGSDEKENLREPVRSQQKKSTRGTRTKASGEDSSAQVEDGVSHKKEGGGGKRRKT